MAPPIIPAGLRPVLVAGGRNRYGVRSIPRELPTCGVTTSNKGYCWGAGDGGRIWRRQRPSSDTRRWLSLGGGAIARLSPRDMHSCGVTTDNRVLLLGI